MVGGKVMVPLSSQGLSAGRGPWATAPKAHAELLNRIGVCG